MARTNIVIDEELIRSAMQNTGTTTKKAVVEIALRKLVNQASLARALGKLKGTLHWEGDVKLLRKSRR